MTIYRVENYDACSSEMWFYGYYSSQELAKAKIAALLTEEHYDDERDNYKIKELSIDVDMLESYG